MRPHTWSLSILHRAPGVCDPILHDASADGDDRPSGVWDHPYDHREDLLQNRRDHPDRDLLRGRDRRHHRDLQDLA